jgi:hypothetical protein
MVVFFLPSWRGQGARLTMRTDDFLISNFIVLFCLTRLENLGAGRSKHHHSFYYSTKLLQKRNSVTPLKFQQGDPWLATTQLSTFKIHESWGACWRTRVDISYCTCGGVCPRNSIRGCVSGNHIGCSASSSLTIWFSTCIIKGSKLQSSHCRPVCPASERTWTFFTL